MAKIVLDTVTGGYDLSVINNNFDKIETELQNKVLYRNNPVGEANTLETDVDANGKRIYNLPEPLLDSEPARLQDLQNAVAGAAANLITFTPYGSVGSTNVQAAIQELIDEGVTSSELAASDGSNLIGFQQTGTGAVSRTSRNKLRDFVTLEDFGAVGDGVTDDSASIALALGSGHSRIIGKNTYKVSSLQTVPVGVTFIFNKLIPSSSSVSVLRQYGGSSVEGTIDTSAFPTYSGIAHQFDGNGENVSAPFRLHIKTYASLVINGGGSTGTAIYFKATDTNARIMGVTLFARINGFLNGVFIEQTSADLSKFITSNYINIDSSDTIVALSMNSSHVNGYGLDGNNFVVKSQPKSGTTSIIFKLSGQDNRFDLLPWDWDTVVGTAPKAASLQAASRRNIIEWHTNETYLDNLSSDDSNIIALPHASKVKVGKLATSRTDGVLPAPSLHLELDNNFFYRAKTTGGTSRNLIGYNASDALTITGVNSAGANIILDTANATGIFAFRCNGVNKMFIDTASVTPGTDNAVTCGSASNRWSVVYAATGTINTSDIRSKTEIRNLTEQEQNVARKLKSGIKAYKFKDAVVEKGTNARIHFGIIAQEVIKAFESEGLDANSYGIVCYDSWEETKEQRDEEGNITVHARTADSRYGVRYEELLAFIISVL